MAEWIGRDTGLHRLYKASVIILFQTANCFDQILGREHSRIDVDQCMAGYGREINGLDSR